MFMNLEVLDLVFTDWVDINSFEGKLESVCMGYGKKAAKIIELGYSVVIIEYVSGDHLFACLDSVQSQSKKPEKIVVVVNGIEDKQRLRLKTDYKKVSVIDPKSNLGYAKAANLGISNTSSPIVLTLNPDAVLEKEAAAEACGYLETRDDVGTVGPRIYESNGNIYPSARMEPSTVDAIGHALLGFIKPDNPFTNRYKNVGVDPEAVREVGWLSGAAVFIRRDALDDVGGWDEDYFMYCEDIDLGRKMRINHWKNVYLPTSLVTHVQGVSTSRAPISLLVAHHKSLYRYASKKYKNNVAMKILVGIFIAFRLPLAIAARIFRIN